MEEVVLTIFMLSMAIMVIVAGVTVVLTNKYCHEEDDDNY